MKLRKRKKLMPRDVIGSIADSESVRLGSSPGEATNFEVTKCDFKLRRGYE